MRQRDRRHNVCDSAQALVYLAAMTMRSVLDELAWRGMVYQQSEGLAAALASPLTAYAGFDPTASSLHVGNLLPIMALVHLQRAGHRPIALVGGGTGLIGDPSGRTSERPLLTLDMVAANVTGIRRQLEHFLDFTGRQGALLRNNSDWLVGLGAVDFMRDVGKHFSVNVMLAKDSVKSRLDSGISYTEFSYMLLQAYDFLELKRRDDATLQVGGSDQWGNITAGVDLIRRATGEPAHALTVPLVTTTGGVKFGKSEAGAVWLDPALTSPYAFYQFWINTDDRDLGRYLRYFTDLSRDDVAALDRATEKAPGDRVAQRTLAEQVTSRTHGDALARVAREVAALLFAGGNPHDLSRPALDALRGEVPFVTVSVAPSAGIDVLDTFVAAQLAPSRGAARRLLAQGGLRVNGDRLAAEAETIERDALLHGRYLLLRKGSREYALVAVAAE
ncbi:MAG: tyrosine--tRNA ligase [Gemmatimonadaceae bacterium]